MEILEQGRDPAPRRWRGGLPGGRRWLVLAGVGALVAVAAVRLPTAAGGRVPRPAPPDSRPAPLVVLGHPGGWQPVTAGAEGTVLVPLRNAGDTVLELDSVLLRFPGVTGSSDAVRRIAPGQEAALPISVSVLCDELRAGAGGQVMLGVRDPADGRRSTVTLDADTPDVELVGRRTCGLLGPTEALTVVEGLPQRVGRTVRRTVTFGNAAQQFERITGVRSAAGTAVTSSRPLPIRLAPATTARVVLTWRVTACWAVRPAQPLDLLEIDVVAADGELGTAGFGTADPAYRAAYRAAC